MSHAPTATLSRRHEAARLRSAQQAVDALVVTSLPNVLYLTNFTGSAAIVVLTAARLYFVTDFRYVAALDATRGRDDACPGLELVLVEDTYDETLARLLDSLAARRIGFEADHLTVSRLNRLAATLATGERSSPELVPTEGIVEAARLRKDGYELETLREAARRISAVAVAIREDVQRGRTEAEVALAIDTRIRLAGFERSAFETIVAAGPNGALPHARPGGRKLAEGDLVVLDFGGVFDSYCVDLTRTVSVGKASDRARGVHAAVREAHDRAIAAVAPGVSPEAVDAAARGVLTAHGLGEAFGHGTGHGLGLEVHELPRISTRKTAVADQGTVAPGMVFTIEPGAYLPGWGGVRIEDDVVVTETGVEVITDVPTDLVEL
jgi:Xaa-Pro aminopeptidase